MRLGGDPNAELDSALLGEDGRWTVTLTGNFPVRSSGPAGRRSPHPSGCLRLKVTVSTSDPDAPWETECLEPSYE